MNIKDMMFISLFTAIIGILAFFRPIPVPFPSVPVTAQTLGVMLASGVLGAHRGGMTLLLSSC
ncbi:ECF transporter S component [Oceanobacillus oncorhynchi]|uniref:ECF transporter S component n=1 Tax=Oceanobacillus oncorhynchi TaxID=545501 RepID=UPI0018678423|nr:ECF transporter S component [Oceanobacillus oncorhynchi]